MHARARARVVQLADCEASLEKQKQVEERAATTAAVADSGRCRR